MDSTMVNVPQLADEVAGVKFGDERLTNRLVRVVEALGSRPHDSIPAATATRTELEGTYRFFANEKVTPDLILSTHFECTRRRCSEQSVALLVQDTTEVDLTQLTEQMTGAGPLSGERHSDLRHFASRGHINGPGDLCNECFESGFAAEAVDSSGTRPDGTGAARWL